MKQNKWIGGIVKCSRCSISFTLKRDDVVEVWGWYIVFQCRVCGTHSQKSFPLTKALEEEAE